MATWWELTFTGEPAEGDFEHVAGMVKQGFTSGQLTSEPGGEDREGPATGHRAGDVDLYAFAAGTQATHTHRCSGQVLRHAHEGGQYKHGYYEHPEDAGSPR
jgi:hypothetical protein